MVPAGSKISVWARAGALKPDRPTRLRLMGLSLPLQTQGPSQGGPGQDTPRAWNRARCPIDLCDVGEDSQEVVACLLGHEELVCAEEALLLASPGLGPTDRPPQRRLPSMQRHDLSHHATRPRQRQELLRMSGYADMGWARSCKVWHD